MKKFLLALCCLLASYTQAQQKFSPADYKKKPYWIEMMNDEKANFHEVVKAYTLYWENHTPPEGEGDMDVKQKAKNKKRFSKKEIQQAREDARMRMAIKKYKWWIQKMEPFVQDDGTILRTSPKN
jgi:hypothetical protein